MLFFVLVVCHLPIDLVSSGMKLVLSWVHVHGILTLQGDEQEECWGVDPPLLFAQASCTPDTSIPAGYSQFLPSNADRKCVDMATLYSCGPTARGTPNTLKVHWVPVHPYLILEFMKTTSLATIDFGRESPSNKTIPNTCWEYICVSKYMSLRIYSV